MSGGGTHRAAPHYGTPAFDGASSLVRAVAGARAEGRGAWRVLARAPSRAGRAARLVAGLPWVEVECSASPAGIEIQALLNHRLAGVLPAGRLARGTLAIPATEEEYLRGRRRQAVRTNLHRAQELGVVGAAVDGAGERVRTAREVIGPRSVDDQATLAWLEEMLATGAFWAAFTADGTPLVFASAAVDVRCAYLRAFMTSHEHAAATWARYVLHVHVVAELAKGGVRFLLTDGALSQPPGVQYFQHLVGFTPANVKVRRLRRASGS